MNAVCQVFHQEGSWAEVVSGFEYEKALGNGVPGNKIIFNGPDKTDEQLIAAARNNSLIHIDHYDELYSLIRLSEENNLRPRVAVRVNMDTGIYPKWDRFGFNFENGQAWNAITRIISAEKVGGVRLQCLVRMVVLSGGRQVRGHWEMCDVTWIFK